MWHFLATFFVLLPIAPFVFVFQLGCVVLASAWVLVVFTTTFPG